MKSRKAKVILLVAALCLLTFASGIAMGEKTDIHELFGTTTGYTYSNSFLGLGCTLKNWRFLSEKDIAKIYHSTIENLPNEVAELIDKAQNITIMAAEARGGLQQNINIQIQNMKPYIFLYNLSGLEGFIDSQMKTLESTLIKAGYQFPQLEKNRVAIGQQSYIGIKTSYVLQGVKTFQQQFCFVKDEFMVYITLTSRVTDSTEKLLSYFFQLDE